MRRNGWTAIVFMGVLLSTLAPAAVPVGRQLPFFVGTDLTGTQRRSSELTGGDVPLVTLILPAMQSWRR